MMKKIILILLLSTFLLPAKTQDAWKLISIYSGSILLDAVGDGLNDNGNKEWGHFCNATSVGILLTSPFLIDYQKKKWGWYIASYVGLRIGLFDYAYNTTRNLPLNYIGNTSNWDRFLNHTGWPLGLKR